MNILFFLTPKAMCAYIEAGDTLRQAMERMEHSGYAALPVIDKSGKYCGVVTEGDLLWTIKRLCVMDLRQTEEHSISEIGTTVLLVMSGWRARMRFSWPSVRTSGQMARMANDSRARAKMHSSSSSTS